MFPILVPSIVNGGKWKHQEKENEMPLLQRSRSPIGSVRHMVASKTRNWFLWWLLLAATLEALGTSSALLLSDRPVHARMPRCSEVVSEVYSNGKVE